MTESPLEAAILHKRKSSMTAGDKTAGYTKFLHSKTVLFIKQYVSQLIHSFMKIEGKLSS